MSDQMTPARRVLAMRKFALEINDLSMVRECDAQLARWGISADDEESLPETTAAAPVEARPVRAKKPTPTKR